MLVIHESAKKLFEDCKGLARGLGLTSQFAKQLRYLQEYACHGKSVCRVILYPDFAPYSFSLVWERRMRNRNAPLRPAHPQSTNAFEPTEGGWVYWFNGGLIFHGPHDRGGDGGAPTFSVNLNPHHGWSIHT